MLDPCAVVGFVGCFFVVVVIVVSPLVSQQ